MKRLYIALTLFLSSFFLYSSNILASTYSYTFTDTQFNRLENINQMIQLSDNKVSSTYQDYHYFIRFNTNMYKYQVLFFPSYIYFSNSTTFSVSTPMYVCLFNSSFTVIENCASTNTPGVSFSLDMYPLYSSSDISFINNSDTITYTYETNSYSVGSGTSINTIPTIYDLDYIFREPPAPQDSMPLLTEFYSVAGSKISYLGEAIVNNYLYLSIIGIFILIFIIELIRRYFL